MLAYTLLGVTFLGGFAGLIELYADKQKGITKSIVATCVSAFSLGTVYLLQ